MLSRCASADRVASPIRTAFPDFVRSRACSASSANPERGWSRSSDAQKNGLRSLWADAVRLLRSPSSPGPRPSVRRAADLRADRGAPDGVSALWSGEAGAPGLPGRQSPVHEALRVLRRQALPLRDDPGHRGGARAPLANGQGPREAVHARAAAASRNAGAEGDRDRRDLDPEAAHLPDRGERSGPDAADLVWRPGSLRGQHGPLLSGAGAQEDRRHSPGGDGHVPLSALVGRDFSPRRSAAASARAGGRRSGGCRAGRGSAAVDR